CEPKDAAKCTDHQGAVIDRIEVDEPDAIRAAFDEVGRELEHQSRLTNAASAYEGDQPRLRKELRKFTQLALATNEGRDLLRQIVRRRFQRPQRRKVLSRTRGNDLKHVLGTCQVA